MLSGEGVSHRHFLVGSSRVVPGLGGDKVRRTPGGEPTLVAGHRGVLAGDEVTELGVDTATAAGIEGATVHDGPEDFNQGCSKHSRAVRRSLK